MAPVNYGDRKADTRRVRFLTGVFHDGQDYGPELGQDEADINPVDALQYVQQGRAVYIDVSEEEAVDGTIVPDEETVIGGGSSTRAVVGGGAVNIGDQGGPDDEILAEGFPGHTQLAAASITTYAQLRAVADPTEIPGIGKATAEKIRKALKARPQITTPRPGLDTGNAGALVDKSRGK